MNARQTARLFEVARQEGQFLVQHNTCLKTISLSLTLTVFAFRWKRIGPTSCPLPTKSDRSWTAACWARSSMSTPSICACFANVSTKTVESDSVACCFASLDIRSQDLSPDDRYISLATGEGSLLDLRPYAWFV